MDTLTSADWHLIVLCGMLATLVAIFVLLSYALSTSGKRGGGGEVSGWLRTLHREPVRVRTAVLALFAVAGSFGLPVSTEQQAVIVAAVLAVLGLFGELTRAVVTPVADPRLPAEDAAAG